jgi:hypothetical protein
MRIQLTKPIGGLLIAGLLVLPSLVLAQPSAHYVPGLEGIKAATLPPPGWWLRDYNIAYQSSHIDDAQGNKIGAAGAHAFIYANAPRLIWITEQQVFGGYLGLDALVPLQYTHLKVNTPGGQFYSSTFGIGDVFAEGSWSKHTKQFDFALAFGAFAPTGNSAPPLTTRAGQGYWTYMFTAGATWYIDEEKKWAVSALNRYEFSTEKEDTERIPGQAYTLEWGVSREIAKGIDFGAVGYYQQQVNPTSGSAWGDRNRVAAAGPEISAFFPQWMLGVSFRYEYEFMAESRLQGQTFSLTVTKKF